MPYQLPRGMRDILPEEVGRWQALEQRIRALAERFGFRELRTPVVEHTEVFARTSGEESDLVQREMYTFTDRGGRSLTLRPEGTAAVMRAYIEHGGSSWPQPVKLYYIAPMFLYSPPPMFRSDRPELGRYRQHAQSGAEIVGVPGPEADAEVIGLPIRLMQSLGLAQGEVRLNSIGDPVCRPRYLEALRDYFSRYTDALCAHCRRRLQTNPLRILDCKEEGCHRIAREAPTIYGYLDAACREHFEGVQAHFQALNVPFVLDPFIVRGLDYYTRTAVEVYSGKLGAQNTMFGGGRYDGLAEQLDGPPTPGVGFGLGLERLLLVLEQEGLPIPTVEAAPTGFVVAVGGDLRNRAVRAQMRHPDKLGAHVALILGDAELATREATLRMLATGDERRVPLAQVTSAVAAIVDGRP